VHGLALDPSTGSSFDIGYTGGPPTSANLASLAGDVVTAWGSNLASFLSADGVLVEVQARDLANPGTTIPCGKVKVRRDGAWLRIVLPSGRALCYPGPKLEAEKRKKKDAELVETSDIFNVDEEVEGTGRTKITYMGVNQYSRKWGRIDTYGGKLFENICQAVARDVMAHNMPAIEAAGYQIVLTVHDEIVAEAQDDPRYNPEHLAALLCAPPPWALDMPLAAAGFESYRYKK